MPNDKRGSKHFGVMVRAAREEAGLEANDLGTKLGYGRGFIWSFERGECTIQPKALDKLCEILPKLAAHRAMAPLASRVWGGKANYKPKTNGAVSKTNGTHAPAPEDSLVSLARMVKDKGLEKVMELAKVIEAVSRVMG
jgi:Helix-turn-helix domain